MLFVYLLYDLAIVSLLGPGVRDAVFAGSFIQTLALYCGRVLVDRRVSSGLSCDPLFHCSLAILCRLGFKFSVIMLGFTAGALPLYRRASSPGLASRLYSDSGAGASASTGLPAGLAGLPGRQGEDAGLQAVQSRHAPPEPFGPLAVSTPVPGTAAGSLRSPLDLQPDPDAPEAELPSAHKAVADRAPPQSPHRLLEETQRAQSQFFASLRVEPPKSSLLSSPTLSASPSPLRTAILSVTGGGTESGPPRPPLFGTETPAQQLQGNEAALAAIVPRVVENATALTRLRKQQAFDTQEQTDAWRKRVAALTPSAQSDACQFSHNNVYSVPSFYFLHCTALYCAMAVAAHAPPDACLSVGDGADAGPASAAGVAAAKISYSRGEEALETLRTMLDEAITSMGEHLVYISSLTEEVYAALCANPYSLPGPAAAALDLLKSANAYFKDYPLGLARCPLRFGDVETQLNLLVVRCINEAWHLGMMSAEDYNTIQECLVRCGEAKVLLDPEALDAYRKGVDGDSGLGELIDDCIFSEVETPAIPEAPEAPEAPARNEPPFVPLGLPPPMPLAPGEALSIELPID